LYSTVIKNRDIKHKEIQLITAEGVNKGVTLLEETLKSLDTKEFDLIQVSRPGLIPPICKIVSRKETIAKQKQKKPKPTVLKELEMNSNIGSGDLDTKLSRLRQFLEKGYQVKITIMNRGERSPQEMLQVVLRDMNCLMIGNPLQQGKKLMFTLKPKPGNK
jgi:translation initiation factor IF-3